MKLYNIATEKGVHLAVEGVNGIVDVTDLGFDRTMDELIAGADMTALAAYAADSGLKAVENPAFANIVNRPDKLLCVGLNYAAHAAAVRDELAPYPTLFSKFANALTYCGADIYLPEWENSYDYEAELVIVMGRTAWNVSEEEAPDCIFGYTCGNDLSLRRAQKRTSQWLAGKSLPGFGPCGPCITTADSISPEKGLAIQSYVNGEIRQNGTTADMLYKPAEIIAYASKYIRLEPGDLIFTGTPAGVALEKSRDERVWLKPGDTMDVVIEGIGTLSNKFI